MYSNTRFQQLLEGMPRHYFERVVQQEQADKYAKGFRCWDQLLAMMFCQLSGVRSLRQLEAGFNAQAGYHYHLGTRAIKRSTLADANHKRSSHLYSRLVTELLHRAHRTVRQEVGSLVYLLDSSPIRLTGPGFDDWVRAYRTPSTQGIKLHLMLERNTHLPVFAHISAGHESDIRHGRKVMIEAGATYVFDKGYTDYGWWKRIDDAGACFVARLKKNAAVAVVQQQAIETNPDWVYEDATIRFTRKVVGPKNLPNPYRHTLARRIIVQRPDKATPLILVTNDFTRSAQEVAALYKQRWEIELFFKWIKQNLKIKQFLGRSENAVRTQIYIALITYLLLYFYRQKQPKDAVTDNLALYLCAIKTSLFQRPETEYRMRLRRQHELESFRRLQTSFGF